MAEFILETSYLSRQIIRQTDSSKYKSEDEFCSIICLDILRGLHDGCFGVEEPSCENRRNQSLSCGNFVKKTVYVLSRYKFRDELSV